MSDPITVQEFEQRLVTLCGGADPALPRKRRDRHILFRSAVQELDPESVYSERSLNEVLESWLSKTGFGQAIDHVTLRQYLIDARYLDRDPDGTVYRFEPDGDGGMTFGPGVSDVDPVSVLPAARERAAMRKRSHAHPIGRAGDRGVGPDVRANRGKVKGDA